MAPHLVRTMAKEFEKKYPFIKVTEYRHGRRTLIKRALEEIGGTNIADVIATTGEQIDVMKREGVFKKLNSRSGHYPDEVKVKGKTGFYFVGHYETYASLDSTFDHSSQRSAKTTMIFVEPEMEGKCPSSATTTERADRQQDRIHGTGILEKLADQDGEGAKHVGGGFGRLGGIGRGAALADDF